MRTSRTPPLATSSFDLAADRPATSAASATAATLHAVGLRAAEPVRFHPHGSSRWVVGKVTRVEADGSITIRDPNGAARSFRADVIEVRRPGHRGRLVWRTVRDVALTWEQLELFDIASS